MKLRKIITLATAGTAAASLSLFGVGITAAYAVDQPVTFEVVTGALVIAQTPSVDAAGGGVAQDMPVTTVTDGRSAVNRSAAWTVSANASNLVA